MKASARISSLVLLIVWTAASIHTARTSLAQDKSPQPTELKKFVAQPDASFKWEVREQGHLPGIDWARLHMVSQTWKDTQWKHVVWIVVPSPAEPGQATESKNNPQARKHAMLYITGGGWKSEWGEAGPATLAPSGELQRMVQLVQTTGSPLCAVQHIPFQPMFDGLVEDAMISKTFVEFMKTGDSSWPLLLPMVKGTVRAMDTAEQYVKKQYGFQIEKFTLFGASKRGWTTWLTSAVDPRVDALAPMVIDVLNMPEQMKHQKATWGTYSEQIRDYSSKGIPDHMNTPAGKKLLALVDPYEHRAIITQPKLLIFGTNDRYWPVDACRLYWPDLLGEKHLLYVPNQGHGIKDVDRLLGTLAALQRSRTGGTALPKMDWQFDPKNNAVHLSIDVDQKPKTTRLWSARSDTKDFRDAQWHETSMQEQSSSYAGSVSRDEKYLAVFGEVVIANPSADAFFSTNLQVFEPAGASGKP